MAGFAQGVIRGAIAFHRCHKETLDLVKRARANGLANGDDVSPAAHLLRYRYAHVVTLQQWTALLTSRSNLPLPRVCERPLAYLLVLNA